MRIRLLDTAGAMLAAEGPEALSLRKLAARAGTSTTAVYSLFGGKPGVLRALFIESCTRFGTYLAAIAPSDDPLADLVALGRAYRAGALANPHLYAVMFGSPVASFEPAAEDWAHADATLTPLLDAVRRGVAAELLINVNPILVATALWATMHGLVSLELSRATPPEAGSPTEVFEAALQAGITGWRTPHP